ncbi:hypothetical protein GCM10023172_18420 [Hymenobacter ginsengisoli]|uniref:Secretion system C-terminal sorting domain-containing protein n=1 Tax=Hymenobacter ginsengisoli TaxID=1051626 RepID=A0ABP8QDE3_9BACT|nr:MULTISPECIES: T9SS type A sorting domain-containing protein [unclassified Hymenobacter]MBO2031599.1 T9SS type A sorting domain-containing protein [Hymenobacter sp. BT559]
MTNPYARVSAWGQRLRRYGLAALLAGGATCATQAQNLYYTAPTATNVAGTYTDLGTSGTAIATANTDDANSAAQNIGFTFSYSGNSFTQFVLNTNGFIKLGAAAPSAAAMYLDENTSSTVIDPFESPNDASIIAPLNVDLTAGAAGGTEYRVATTGTAPNRVCTIQWKNVSDKASVRPTQYTNLSFQVRLYEGTNVIELVYGAATKSTTAASYRFTQVGLKGTSFATAQLVQVVKNPATRWADATFADFSAVAASGYLNAFIISSLAPPDAGRTYRFTPAPPVDVAVQAIFTLGELATPTALPQSVQAVVTNVGYQTLTNVPVALSVTGANTFNNTQTVASLDPGSSTTVTFAAYPATLNTGTNTLSVTATVANDANAANNTATFSQQVTSNLLSYLDLTNKQFTYSNVDTTKAGGVQAIKFTVTQPTTLTNATVLLAGLTTTPTTPVTYKVVVYAADGKNGAPGTVLYTSPNQNRPTKTSAVTVSLGNVPVPAGSFFVGVQETSPGGSGLLLQEETPSRPGTYYLTLDGSTWYDLNDFDLGFRYAIEVQLGTTPTCDPTAPITSYPYTQNFDLILAGQTLPCGFTVLDANNDKATWAISKINPNSGTNDIRYTSALTGSVAADDWFFTPPLTTAANTRYQVAFRYRGEGIAPATSSYTEKLEVKVGNAPTPAAQTTTLYTNTAITNTAYALADGNSTPAVAVFTPGAGTQYVGFHVFSAANQGNLYIDDLSITAGVVTATSSALLRAVTVFPNPSATGLFDLEIHGAQAKGAMGVLVTNALGQQVYVGAARDNYTNRLDLSGLPPGLYYLQVRNGDETMTRQLAIAK